MLTQKIGLTSYKIKLAAIIIMTLDHIGAILGQSGLSILIPPLPSEIAGAIAAWFRVVGRMAFPLFAFFIVEGILHTRNVRRYLARLFIFAVISEPFYYFGFTNEASVGGFFDSLARLNFTNVFFTLAISASALALFRYIDGVIPKYAPILDLLVSLAALYIAEYIDCDYGALGALLVIGLYFAARRGRQAAVVCVWAVLTYILRQAYYGSGFEWSYISFGSLMYTLSAALSSVLVLLYNGQRGRTMKWFFYIYYPAHILVLKLVLLALEST